MIVINDKSRCCGCSACSQICPTNCISMVRDEEGFLYPVVNESECIKCDLCLKVCPYLNEKIPQKPIKVFAVKNKDNHIRNKSSSGGFFSNLSNLFIDLKGVVYGVTFNSGWTVYHDSTDTLEGINKFRSSKYIQSDINNTYISVKKDLEKGKHVLFTDTPCQIDGLNLFLFKDYPNLITLDTVCLGIPSPLIFEKYLKEVLANSKNKIEDIKEINFRTKSEKWKATRLTIKTNNDKYLVAERPQKNAFLKGFGKGLYMRLSCHNCVSKNFRNKSDITIGDYWGIDEVAPSFNDKKGISLVMINSEKGLSFFDKVKNIEKIETSYNNAFKNNFAIEKSLSLTNNRKLFYDDYQKYGVIKTVNLITKEKNIEIFNKFITYYNNAIIRKTKNIYKQYIK